MVFVGNGPYGFAFNLENFKHDTATVDSRVIVFRVYENVVYVSKPVDVIYQCMNIYIIDAYYNGVTLNASYHRLHLFSFRTVSVVICKLLQEWFH